MATTNTIQVNAVLNNSQFQSRLRSMVQDLQRAGRESNSAAQQASNMGSSFKGAAAAMAGIGAATAGIAAVGKGLQEAVKAGMSYTKQMSKVEAMSGASSYEMAQLGANARELGKSTVWSATNVAEAYEYMALAGWDTNAMLEASKPLLNLATAGALDLAKASDIVTDTMTPFRMGAEEAGRAADVFAVAQSKANLNVEQLGETMKYAAPIADTFGMNLEETTVIAQQFANGGIKASMAGTALRAGLSRLAAPPKTAREALAGLNVTMTDSEGNMKNIRDIIAEMSPKFNELAESEQIAAAKAIFGEEAYAGWVMVLKNGVGEFDRLKADLDNSSGAAETFAGVMANNLSGALANASSAAENLGLVIFSNLEAALTGATNSTTGFIEKLTLSLDPYGRAVEATKLLQTEQQKYAQTQALLNKQEQEGLISKEQYKQKLAEAEEQLKKNTTQEGLMAQAKAAVDEQLKSGKITQDQYNEALQKSYQDASALSLAMDDARAKQEKWSQAGEQFRELMGKLWEFIKPIWDENLKWFNEQLAKIKQFIDENGEEIKAVWNAIWVFFEYVIKPIWDGIKQAISGALDVIMGIIKTVGAILNGDWESAWDGIKMILSGALDVILGLLNVTLFKGSLGVLKKLTGKLGDGFKKFAGDSLNKVKQWGADILEAPSKIKELPGKIWEWIKDIPNKIKEAFNSAIDWLKRLDWYDIGKNLIKSLIRGIESMFTSLTSTISSVTSKLNPLSWGGGGGGRRYMTDPENNAIGETMPRSPFGFDILDESRGKFNRLPLQFFGGSLQETMGNMMSAVNADLGAASSSMNLVGSQLSAGSRGGAMPVGSGLLGAQSVHVSVDIPLEIDGNVIARATTKYTQPRNANYERRTRTPWQV